MKQRTIYLSRSERRIGGHYYLQFASLNGLGATLLGTTSATLLAIHFNAGNVELGIISAMMYSTGIILLAVPRLFRGKNVVKVASWAWLSRGILSLPYGALLFLKGKTAVALILGLYAIFCICRTVGVAMLATIQKRLTVSRTQSELVFRNASSFQGTQIIARFAGYIILSLKNLTELTGLLIQPALGIIANTLAALSLRKIPNRTRVDYVKGENIFTILKRSMALPQKRRILLLRWIALAQVILFAMATPFLRRSAGLNSASIFMFTIAGSMGSFISSFALRPVSSRSGNRPLMFFSAIPCALLFLFWTFIPATLSLAAYAVAGFITIFFLNAVNLAASSLLMLITPDQEAVGFNSMETFVTSILALALGFGAGILADVSEVLSGMSPMNSYGLVFLPAALGAVVQSFIVLKVKEPGSMGLVKSLKILTNLGNLRAWQTLSNLENTADPVKRKTLVHSVGHSRAPVASPEILKILYEPLSLEKGELIDALFFTRRPELIPFLCSEAECTNAFHRERAVFALGAYPDERSRHTLKNLLSDPDSRIRASAAKSLGRIGAPEFKETVEALWKNETHLQQRLDYMIALFHMDPRQRYISDLFSQAFINEGERSEKTLFTLLSRQFGMSPQLGHLYREETEQRGCGVELLLEEARDTRFLMENETRLEELWMGHNFSHIWEICLQALPQDEPASVLTPLIKALRSFNVRNADEANTLAVMYFTYQILTSEPVQEEP